jgi:hypothetical protein
MKEDVLEQIVDDYLQFRGYFTVHNVSFRPDPAHPAYEAAKDRVPSDVDVIGLPCGSARRPDPSGDRVAAGSPSPARLRVRPDHDHMHRPFVGRPPMKRISGGHSSLGADATLLSSHAGGPRTAARDTSFAGQTWQSRRDRHGSARRRPEDLPAGPDITGRTIADSDSDDRPSRRRSGRLQTEQ